MISRIGIQKGEMIRNMGLVWSGGARIARSPWMAISILSTIKAPGGFFRSVHNTSKKNHTSLIASDLKHSAFHKMSLNALKNECRSRGLKVSGKKAELIDRITSFNGSGGKMKPVKKQKMSTYALKETSKPIASVRLRAAGPSIKIPRTQEMSTKATTLLHKAHSKSTQGTIKASDSVIATVTQATNQPNLRDAIDTGSDLTWRDRLFLTGFAAAVVLWWGATSSERETG